MWLCRYRSFIANAFLPPAVRSSGAGNRIQESADGRRYLYIPLLSGPPAPVLGSEHIVALHNAYDTCMATRATRALDVLARQAAAKAAGEDCGTTKTTRRKRAASARSASQDSTDSEEDDVSLNLTDDEDSDASEADMGAGGTSWEEAALDSSLAGGQDLPRMARRWCVRTLYCAR